MADLDDFFAKKDRKKAKGRKFTTADEIAKKLEETGKRNEKLKKEKMLSQAGQEVNEQGSTVQDEDEWKDFEEEKKDYTGLKIQNLALTESEDGTDGVSGGEDEDGGMEENEAGEMVPKKKSGPWKVVSESSSAESVVPPQPEIVLAPTIPQKSQSYKPPAMRTDPLPFNKYRFKPAAPDVKNEELFPSLSSSLSAKVHHDTSKNRLSKREEASGSGFEEVKAWRSSNPDKYQPPHMRPNLTLGNKYGALSNDPS